MIASDKRTVRCEGNLAEISDDDSSDGEERTPSESNAFADDDDDEELEVFTGAKKRSTRTRPKVVKASENPVAASPTQEVGKQGLEEEAPRSLVNLMAASVSAVEKGSIPTGASQSTQGKVASTGSGGVDEESKDAFGIAYKPMFKQKETNYNVPKGPAFEDEAEFEREFERSRLAQKTAGAAADDTDEFDFDDDSSPPVTSSLQAALEKAKLNAVVEDSNIEAIRAVEKASAVSETASRANQETAASGAKEERFDVRKAAQEAFEGVSNVYGSGLGDQDVQLLGMDANVADAEASAGGAAKPAMGVNDIIEEVDEEELEAAEAAEEQHEATRKASVAAQQQRLEQEWNDLDSERLISNEADSEQVRTRAQSDIDNMHKIFFYDECLQYLRSIDLSPYESLINVSTIDEKKEGFFSRTFKGSNASLNFDNSEALLKWPFLLAQRDWIPSKKRDLQCMQSIYRRLLGVGDEVDCGAVGSHWGDIGFQGNDPCTDVNRSMKMLAVLQMLNLIETQPILCNLLFELSRYGGEAETKHTTDYDREAESSKNTYESRLSAARAGVKRDLSEDLTWPFACVSIMFTKEALQTLRAGSLNKVCNKRQDVLKALHEFHQACFVEFGRRLVADSTKHHAMHLADLRKEIEGNPTGLLKGYYKVLEDLQRECDEKGIRMSGIMPHETISLECLLFLVHGNAVATTTKPKSRLSVKSLMNIGVGKNGKAGKKPNTEAGVSNPAAAGSQEPAPMLERFDNLESLNESNVREKSRSGSGTGSGSGSGNGKGLWSSLTGGRKADKFKVEDS